MFGTRTSISSLACVLLLSSYASGQDYFPLHAGNQWIWRSADRGTPQLVTAEIARTETFEGREYSLLTGFFGHNQWVRMDENGTLRAYNPESKSEAVWAAFSTREGGTYETGIDPCNPSATVNSRSARFSGPIGESESALELRYPPGPCADAGLTSEIYLPYIGLVERNETSIAGPRRFELIYARLGGVTVVAEKETSFSLSLDRLTYRPGDTPTVRFTVRNTSGRPLQLNFPSGQSFDAAIRNSAGDIVYVWSRDKLFTQVYRTESVSGERNWAVILEGLTLRPGRYTLEGWLTTDPPRLYTATVMFEVLEPQPQP